MSNRERWIVYPLLIFAIVSIVFDRMGEQSFVHYDRIHCEELVVASPQGSPRIVLQQSPEGLSGLITIHGPPAGTIDSERTNYNDVQTEIGANDAGGFLRIKGADGVPALYLGHVSQRQASGLVATDQHGDLLAAAAEDGAVPDTWGSILSWEDVPNARRDFDDAKASLQPNEDTTNEESGDENTADVADESIEVPPDPQNLPLKRTLPSSDPSDRQSVD